MITQDVKKVEVTYRRWIISIPILLILFGSTIMAVVGPYNSTIGLIGGMMVFVGILIFGTLLAIIIGIEMGARTLAQKTVTRSSFREQLEDEPLSVEENQ